MSRVAAGIHKAMWGALWISQNRLDGRTVQLQWKHGYPLVFRTRAEARAFIDKEWGYIRDRKDLRVEPHGWRLPRAVRIKVSTVRAT